MEEKIVIWNKRIVKLIDIRKKYICREKMYKEEKDQLRFSWKNFGEIEKGRPNLGSTVPGLFYRLLQYTLRRCINQKIGFKKLRRTYLKKPEDMLVMNFARLNSNGMAITTRMLLIK